MRFLYTDTVARKFVWRALPLSALLMAAIWIAAGMFVERTIRVEGERIVERATADSAGLIRLQLTHLVEFARDIARNELLVSSLLDRSGGGNAFILPAFLRSLRLPDVSRSGVALLDYDGAAMAHAGVPIPDQLRELTEQERGSARATLSGEGFRGVFPVRYDASVEGYLLVWVPEAAMSELFANIFSTSLGQITVHHGEAVLFQSCCEAIHDEIVSRLTPVEGFPTLAVRLRVDRHRIFPVAFQLNWFLLGAFGADVLVLLAVSLFAAAAVARPLRRMVREIRAAPKPAALRLQGYDSAPREVRFLAKAFNAAAAHLTSEMEQRLSALRQAEAHAVHNELLATVIEHSTNGIAIRDARTPGQPFIYANPAFFRITGFEPPEVIGSDGRFLGENITDPETMARLREAVADHREIKIEVQSLRKGGGMYWALLSLYLVHDDTGAVTHIIGVLIDITEQRQLRETVARSAHLTSLGELATGLAHELNQPLNVIRLASANLAHQLAAVTGLPRSVGDKLDRIERNVERAAGIIDHMKVFGRGDSGQVAPFRLRDAVDGALQIVAAELRSNGIEIVHDLGAEDPFALGKPLAVEQVVVNLVLNARDAILAHRTDNARDGDDRITIGLTTCDAMTVLSVEDTGGGIPDDIQTRIFEPFFTTKPPGKGTGLGLSVSFGIAAELGGSLMMRNAVRGARFELRLPLARTDAQRLGAAR